MNFRDILLALLVIIIWGGNIIAIKIGVTELSPLTLLTLRFGITALIFLPFFKWPGIKKFWLLAEISLYICIFHQALLFSSLKMLDASTIAVLLQSQILFATLLGWLILKESIGWRTAVGLSLGFAGILLTFGKPDLGQNPLGFVLAMMSTLVLAYGYIRMRNLQDVHAATYIVMINGTSVLPAFLLSLIFAPLEWGNLSVVNWTKVGGVMLYQCLLVSLSHILWQSLLSRNKVASVTSFILLMPIISILAAAVILNEDLHPSLIGSGILVLAGVGIITLRKAQKNQPVPACPES